MTVPASANLSSLLPADALLVGEGAPTSRVRTAAGPCPSRKAGLTSSPPAAAQQSPAAHPGDFLPVLNVHRPLFNVAVSVGTVSAFLLVVVVVTL